MCRLPSILAALCAVSLAGCSSSGGGKSPTPATPPPAPAQANPGVAAAPASPAPKVVTLRGGLQYSDLKVGNGPMAETGMTVALHYTGWLADGTKFDSSRDGGDPLVIQLGAGQVIQGWEEGIVGMRVGGKRKLTIPPDLAYGDRGAGDGVIPPGATLIFEVDLLDIKR